jgi:hypothetical protein
MAFLNTAKDEVISQRITSLIRNGKPTLMNGTRAMGVDGGEVKRLPPRGILEYTCAFPSKPVGITPSSQARVSIQPNAFPRHSA